MTNIKNNNGVLTVSQSNPCVFQIYSDQQFFSNIGLFPRNDDVHFIVYFYGMYNLENGYRNIVWQAILWHHRINKDSGGGGGGGASQYEDVVLSI